MALGTRTPCQWTVVSLGSLLWTAMRRLSPWRSDEPLLDGHRRIGAIEMQRYANRDRAAGQQQRAAGYRLCESFHSLLHPFRSAAGKPARAAGSIERLERLGRSGVKHSGSPALERTIATT